MVLRVYVVPTWCARMCSECEDVFRGKVQASDAARRGLFSVSLNVAIKGFCLEARNVIMQCHAARTRVVQVALSQLPCKLWAPHRMLMLGFLSTATRRSKLARFQQSADNAPQSISDTCNTWHLNLGWPTGLCHSLMLLAASGSFPPFHNRLPLLLGINIAFFSFSSGSHLDDGIRCRIHRHHVTYTFSLVSYTSNFRSPTPVSHTKPWHACCSAMMYS